MSMKQSIPKFTTFSYGYDGCGEAYISIPHMAVRSRLTPEELLEVVSNAQLHVTELAADLRLLQEFLTAQKENDT